MGVRVRPIQVSEVVPVVRGVITMMPFSILVGCERSKL